MNSYSVQLFQKKFEENKFLYNQPWPQLWLDYRRCRGALNDIDKKPAIFRPFFALRQAKVNSRLEVYEGKYGSEVLDTLYHEYGAMDMPPQPQTVYETLEFPDDSNLDYDIDDISDEEFENFTKSADIKMFEAEIKQKFASNFESFDTPEEENEPETKPEPEKEPEIVSEPEPEPIAPEPEKEQVKEPEIEATEPVIETVAPEPKEEPEPVPEPEIPLVITYTVDEPAEIAKLREGVPSCEDLLAAISQLKSS